MATNPNIRVDASRAVVALKAIPSRVNPAVNDALDRGAAKVQEDARAGHPKIKDSTLKNIRRQGKGRDAIDSFRKRTKTNSGEFSGGFRFLTHTANLVNSIQKEKSRTVPGGFQSSVFSSMKYADKIEFGTTRSRAFPFLRPALEGNRSRIAKFVTDAVRNALRGGLP